MLLQLGRGLSSSQSLLPPVAPPAADLTPKTIALLGDSISNQNTSANDREYLSQGYMTMLNTITGHRYDFPTPHNLGVSGDSISQIDARKTDLAALNPAPDIVFVLGGTNDVLTSTTETQMTNDLQSIYDYITGTIGATVIALTIPPRTQHPSGDALSTTDQNKLDAVNNWIMAQSGNVIPVNVFDALTDGSDQPNAQYFNKEGTSNTSYVHPNPVGALKIAETLETRLESYYGQYDIPDLTLDTLLPNNDLSGTGGSNNSPLTGTVTNDHTLYAYSGASGTLSKPTTTSQQIDISYADSTAYDTVQFYPADITSGYTPGDNIVAEAEIEILSGTRVEGLWLEVTDKGGSNLIYKDMAKYDDPEFPTTASTYFLQTPIVTTQNDSTALAVKVRGELNSTGATTASLSFIIKQLRCRKIT